MSRRMAFLHLPPIRWLTSFYNPPNNILYDKPKEGEWISRKMIDPKEEAMSVLNSHPNNHSQYKVEHHQPVNIFE